VAKRTLEVVAGSGPIRTVIEMQGAALSLFSQADRNTILRTLMTIVANAWIDNFLKKRFSNYSRNVLGYDETAGWASRKIRLAKRGAIPWPQPIPFVFTGVSRQTALAGSRGAGTASKDKAVAVIKVPFGHAVQAKTSVQFRQVPASEMKVLAEVAGRELPKLCDAGVATYYEKGPQRQLEGAVSPLPARFGVHQPRKIA
jgi:hypothetical protein